MELTNFKIPSEWKQLFDAAREVRPCSFNPTPYLKATDATETHGPNIFLPLEAKRTWFYAYCKETGAKGKILVSAPMIQFDLCNNSNLRFGFVSSNCDVFLDGEIVGNATAGLAFSIDNLTDMSNAIQTVTGTAQSRALSNAGFGAVSGTDMEVDDNLTGNQESDATLPFTVPAVVPVTAPAAAVGVNDPNPAAVQHSVPQNEMQKRFLQISGQKQLSPVDLAKAVVINTKGNKDNGKTMRDVLTGINGSRNIYYYAFEWANTTNEAIPVRDAARTIWFDMEPAARKAVLKYKPNAPEEAKQGL